MAVNLEKFKQGPRTAVEKLNNIIDEVERIKKLVNRQRNGGSLQIYVVVDGQLYLADMKGDLLQAV